MEPTDLLRLDVWLTAGPTSAASARRLLRERFGGILDREVLERVELLITELVSNSLRHAELRPGDRIEVAVVAAPRSIRAEVEDPGLVFAARRSEETAPGESGWGLYLVDRIAHRWGIEKDGTFRVWFEIDTATAEPSAPPARTPHRHRSTRRDSA